MATTAAEERKVIAQLFNDEEMQVALDKILSGKRLEDKAYEQVVARAFVERAKIGFGGATLFTLSDSDMHSRAAALMGVNDMGKSIIDDDDFIKRNLPEFLELAKDGSENAPLMNAELCRAMIRYANDPEDMRLPEPAKAAFDSVLTDQFTKSLGQKMREGAFKSPLSEGDTNSLYYKLGVAPEPVITPGEEPEPNVEHDLKREPSSPEDTGAEIAPEEAPERGNANLSTDALLQQVGAMEEQADLEARKHRLHVDAQTEAKMAINKIMDENPSWVRRTTIHKLKDKLSNGANSLLGQDPLVYPSESLFGDSLAVMDVNGRVEQTLLHYRSGPGLDRRVEFRSPSVPEEAYKLAALQVKSDGIRKPHISSNFRDPKKAIDFMMRSVDALVDAGYHIDDISVDRHLSQAFENYKLEKHGPAFSIGERPENEQDPEPEPPREVMPEEGIEAKNEMINSPTIRVAEQLADIEKGLGFDDIENDDILPVMPLLAELNNPEQTWQQVNDEGGLSPTARGVVERLKKHVDSIVAKLDPESNIESKYGPKAKDIKLLAKSINLLEPIYGKDVANRVLPVLQEKADEVLKREAEKAEKLANSQNNAEHKPTTKPQTAPEQNSAQQQGFENQSPDGFDPELNGSTPPSHMFDGPSPADRRDDPESMMYDDYSNRDYGEEHADVYIPEEFQSGPAGIDDMSANPAMDSQPQYEQAVEPSQSTEAPYPPESGLDDMAAAPQQESPIDMGEQPLHEGPSGLEQNTETPLQPESNLDDMAAQPNVEQPTGIEQNFDAQVQEGPGLDDMAAPPEMEHSEEPSIDAHAPTNDEGQAPANLDSMTAGPESEPSGMSLDDMAASPEQNTPSDEPESGFAKLKQEEPAPGVPEAWMKRLEELGWQNLTPDQVSKIPKPAEFTEQQKKEPAFTIANTVDTLLKMDEYFVESASPEERAFLERMPEEMLMKNVKSKLSGSNPDNSEVEPEPEPDEGDDYVRRKR